MSMSSAASIGVLRPWFSLFDTEATIRAQQIHVLGCPVLDTQGWDQALETARALARHQLTEILLLILEWRGGARAKWAQIVTSQSERALLSLEPNDVTLSSALNLYTRSQSISATQSAWAVAIDSVVGLALLAVCVNHIESLPVQLQRCITAIALSWIDFSTAPRKPSTKPAQQTPASEQLPHIASRTYAERLVFHIWSELLGLLSPANHIAARCLHGFDILTTTAASADTPSAAAAILSAASATQSALLPSVSLGTGECHMTAPQSLDVALRRLRALCFVELDLSTEKGVEQAAQIVSAATQAHTHNSHGCPPLKDAIARALCSILLPWAPLRLSDSLDCSQWFQTCSQLFDRMSSWSRKAKHAEVALPVLTVVLCSSEKEFFLSHYRSLTQSLLSLRLKHKRTRVLAVSALQCLVHAYLHKNASRKETTLHFLQQLADSLLLDGVSAEVELFVEQSHSQPTTAVSVPFESSLSSWWSFAQAASAAGLTSAQRARILWSTDESSMKATLSAHPAPQSNQSSFTDTLKKWGAALTGQSKQPLATSVDSPAAQDSTLALLLSVAHTHVDFTIEHMILPLLVQAPSLQSSWLKLGLRALATVFLGGHAAAVLLQGKSKAQEVHGENSILSQVVQLMLTSRTAVHKQSDETEKQSVEDDDHIDADELEDEGDDEIDESLAVGARLAADRRKSANGKGMNFGSWFDEVDEETKKEQSERASNTAALWSSWSWGVLPLKAEQSLHVEEVMKTYPELSYPQAQALVAKRGLPSIWGSRGFESMKSYFQLSNRDDSSEEQLKLAMSCHIDVSTNAPFMRRINRGGECFSPPHVLLSRVCSDLPPVRCSTLSSSLIQRLVIAVRRVLRAGADLLDRVPTTDAASFVPPAAEHDVDLTTFRLALLCVPFIWQPQQQPAEWISTSDLIELLMHSLWSKDSDLQYSTMFVLRYLMRAFSEIRSAVINRLVALLTNLPHIFRDKALFVLNVVNELMEDWTLHMVHNNYNMPSRDVDHLAALDVKALQAMSLQWMCDADSNIRSSALQLICACRTLAISIKPANSSDVQLLKELVNCCSALANLLKSKAADVMQRVDDLLATVWADAIEGDSSSNLKLFRFLSAKSASVSAVAAARLANKDALQSGQRSNKTPNQQMSKSSIPSPSVSTVTANEDVATKSKARRRARQSMLPSHDLMATLDEEDSGNIVNNSNSAVGGHQQRMVVPSVPFVPLSTKVIESQPAKSIYLPQWQQAASLSDAHQLKWCLALGEFVRQCCHDESNNETLVSILRAAFNTMFPRLKALCAAADLVALDNHLPTFISTSSTVSPTSSLSVLLRNVAVVCAAATGIVEPYPAAAQSVFTVLVPLLRHKVANVRVIAVAALSCVPRSLLEMLFRELQPLQNDLVSDESSKPAPTPSTASASQSTSFFSSLFSDPSTPVVEASTANTSIELSMWAHLAHIHRTQLDVCIGAADLANRETIRAHLLAVVQRLFRFLSRPGHELRWNLLPVRTHFCALVQLMSDKWFAAASSQSNANSDIISDLQPLDRQQRKEWFEFLLPWCGHGPSSAAYALHENKHRNALLAHIKDDTERQAVEQLFGHSRQRLTTHALLAMTSLLKGEPFDATESNKSIYLQRSVYPWLCDLVSDNTTNSIADNALRTVMQHKSHFADFLRFCYDPDKRVARRWFLALAADLMNRQNTVYPVHALWHLAVFKLGDSNAAVRTAAAELAQNLLSIDNSDQNDSAEAPKLELLLCSRLPDTYSRNQTIASSHFAARFGSRYSHVFLVELAERLTYVTAGAAATHQHSDNKSASHHHGSSQPFSNEHAAVVRSFLLMAGPWLPYVRLQAPRADRQAMMSTLIRLSTDYIHICAAEIEHLWVSLVGGNDIEGESSEQREKRKRRSAANITDALDMLLDWMGTCGASKQAQTGRPLFQIAQRIALFLARAQRRQTVIHLVQVLQRQRENDATEEEESEQQVGLHRMNSHVSVDSVDDSDEELDDDGQKQFSRGDWALVLLVEVSAELFETASEDLMLEQIHLLHVALLSVGDHPAKLMRAHCVRLITTLVELHLKQHRNETATQLLKWLRKGLAGDRLWPRELIGPSNLDAPSSLVLQRTVQSLLTINSTSSQFADCWSKLALDWALHSRSPRAVCRSWQIVRALACSDSDTLIAVAMVLRAAASSGSVPSGTTRERLSTSSDSSFTSLQSTASYGGVSKPGPLPVAVVCEALSTLTIVACRASRSTLLSASCTSLLWDSIRILNQPFACCIVYAMRALSVLLQRLMSIDNVDEVKTLLWNSPASPAPSDPTTTAFVNTLDSTTSAASVPVETVYEGLSLPVLVPPPRTFRPLLPLTIRALEDSSTREAASAFLHCLLPAARCWPALIDDAVSIANQSNNDATAVVLRCVCAQLPWFGAHLKASTQASDDVTAITLLPPTVRRAARCVRTALLTQGWTELARVFGRYSRGHFRSVWSFFCAAAPTILLNLDRHHRAHRRVCESLAARIREGSTRYVHVLLLLLQVLLDRVPQGPREIDDDGSQSEEVINALSSLLNSHANPALARQAALVLQTLWKHAANSNHCVGVVSGGSHSKYLPSWLCGNLVEEQQRYQQWLDIATTDDADNVEEQQDLIESLDASEQLAAEVGDIDEDEQAEYPENQMLHESAGKPHRSIEEVDAHADLSFRRESIQHDQLLDASWVSAGDVSRRQTFDSSFALHAPEIGFSSASIAPRTVRGVPTPFAVQRNTTAATTSSTSTLSVPKSGKPGFGFRGMMRRMSKDEADSEEDE